MFTFLYIFLYADHLFLTRHKELHRSTASGAGRVNLIRRIYEISSSQLF